MHACLRCFPGTRALASGRRVPARAGWMIALGLMFPALGMAQDDPFGDEEDFVFDGDLTDAEDPPKDSDDKDAAPAPAPEPEPLLEDEDDLVFEDEVSEEGERVEDDLFEDETAGTDASSLPGQDTVETFRAKERELAGVAADEEIMAWEAYLETYPNALYRERIEARIQTLLDEQYRRASTGGRLDPADPEAVTDDLRDEEIFLVSPLRLPNLNPRSRVVAGALLGVPVKVQAWADFEYAFLRNLSMHAGLWGRATGWGLEVGVRGSPVKSAKDKVLLTPALDLRLNFGPLLFAVRPQLGVGAILADRVHLLANVGAEIAAQANASAAVFGGLHLSGRIAPPISVFLEADVYARRLTRAEGAFVFASVGLGLRFHPRLKGREDDPLEVVAAGYARAASQYVEPYQGAAAIQAAYYLPSRGK